MFDGGMDDNNSSNSFTMMEDKSKSKESTHIDPSIDGIFTNYCDLRSHIIKEEKTIHQLLDLLNIQALHTTRHQKTLIKIGQCAASAIVFLGNLKLFN